MKNINFPFNQIITVRSRMIATALACSLAAGACTSTGGNEQGGQIIGAAAIGGLGALIGGKAGGSKGAVLGGLLGVGVGYLIGGQIGRYLDEEDRKKASQATLSALDKSYNNNGKPATTKWSSENNKGVSGQTTATSTGNQCYNVQEVAIIPGKGTVRQENKYCQNNGKWEPA